jgi:hypothetical protein
MRRPTGEQRPDTAPDSLPPEAGEEAEWVFSDRRSLLADYGPEDEGLYDGPEALSAMPAER